MEVHLNLPLLAFYPITCHSCHISKQKKKKKELRVQRKLLKEDQEALYLQQKIHFFIVLKDIK